MREAKAALGRLRAALAEAEAALVYSLQQIEAALSQVTALPAIPIALTAMCNCRMPLCILEARLLRVPTTFAHSPCLFLLPQDLSSHSPFFSALSLLRTWGANGDEALT